MRSWVSILLTILKPGQTGKRTVPSGIPRHGFYSSGIQGHAKAEVVVAIRRVVPVAVRRPAVHGIVVPTATTVDAVRAFKVRSPQAVVTQRGGISSFLHLPPDQMQSMQLYDVVKRWRKVDQAYMPFPKK